MTTPVRQRLAARITDAADRLFDRLRDRRSFSVTEHDAIDGDLESLRGRTYALLVTFRRNGDPVPSPVWIALDDHGVAYVKTAGQAGKVKRLTGDSRVLVAPSTARGRPVGPAVRATGRSLATEEWPHAEATLAAGHGAIRRIVERLLGGADESVAYLELTPGR